MSYERHHHENTTCPSPVPPFHRDTQSPQTQTLMGDGAISLTMDTTYLVQDAPKDPQNPDTPYALTLANGSFKRQVKRIYVPNANADTTAKFEVSGTFVGSATLLFSPIGWSAVLEWDGSGWHLVGGNAEPQN